jgi:hypothetical protein
VASAARAAGDGLAAKIGGVAMRKVLLVVLVALTGLAVPTAGSGADDDSPLACADILIAGAAYDSAGDFAVAIRTAAPVCKFVSYTAYVSDGTTTTVLSEPTFAFADGFLFSTNLDDSIPSVCVYAEASVGRGHHVLDRIPDTGCVTIERDAGVVLVED